MKTLKMFKSILVILIVSILVGCSDQITSTSDYLTDPGGSVITGSETGDQLTLNSFSSRIKLNPNREYVFNVSNTKLAKFTSIDVEKITTETNEDKLSINCGNVSIYGDKGTKSEIALSCQSKGFNAKQITIRNQSSRILDLSVSLYGERVKKKLTSEE